MQKRKPPVSKNQQVELKIEGLSHEGAGVGRINNFTVFVPDTVPGDVVSARIISLQKNHARALYQSIMQHSPDRVSPPCKYYPRCGGCQIQHISYDAQLRYKQQLVKDAVERIGGITTHILPTLGMEYPWYYRNKAQVPVRQKGNTLNVGFYEKRSHNIVDLDNCFIQHSANNRAIAKTRSALQELLIPAYDEKNKSGVIRHIMARSSLATTEVVVVLVTPNSSPLPHQESLIRKLRRHLKELSGIVQNINPAEGNVILGNRNKILWGKAHLTESIGGYSFKISPKSFFQVNPPQTESLYSVISNYANLKGTETVLDLYCGMGAISIYLSNKAGKVIGVESVNSAVEDARINADQNNVENTEFHVGKAEDILNLFEGNNSNPEVVIVDPPRKGCEQKLLQNIGRLQPSRFIYVSCNPATLARDLNYLTQEEDFLVQEIQPVDMFPHTSHIECVAKIIPRRDS